MISMFSNSLGAEELEAVRGVFESRWIGFGPESKKFEEELGDKIGSSRVLALNSCTAGLFMSMDILGIGPGDEVIIPSIHFIGAVNAVIKAGATPVFADVDLQYLNILPEEITRLRTEKTRAVFLLHYGGHPCDMEKIYPATKGLYLIEDSANSPFSKYRGINCGLLGDIGIYSFDAMKILCCGNGGAIVVKSDELLAKAKEFRYFGLAAKGQSGIDSLGEKKSRWWEINLGSISNRYLPSDILSAAARIQLRKVDDFLRRRREVWDIYQAELAGLDWLELPPEPLPDTTGSYYFYWLRIKDGRDKFARYLVDNDIYCTFRYYPLHLIEQYGPQTGLPQSELLNEITINIPLHQNLSPEEVEKIVKTIKNFR